MSEPNPAMLRGSPTMGDSELYTGREVKRMIAEIVAAGAHRQRWLGASEAATLMHLKECTLRARARRWAEMPTPPVRVRKLGSGDRSHWLFHEDDVYGFVRRRDVRSVSATTSGEGASANAQAPQEDTISYWDRIVTRNLL